MMHASVILILCVLVLHTQPLPLLVVLAQPPYRERQLRLCLRLTHSQMTWFQSKILEHSAALESLVPAEAHRKTQSSLLPCSLL